MEPREGAKSPQNSAEGLLAAFRKSGDILKKAERIMQLGWLAHGMGRKGDPNAVGALISILLEGKGNPKGSIPAKCAGLAAVDLATVLSSGAVSDEENARIFSAFDEVIPDPDFNPETKTRIFTNLVSTVLKHKENLRDRVKETIRLGLGSEAPVVLTSLLSLKKIGEQVEIGDEQLAKLGNLALRSGFEPEPSEIKKALSVLGESAATNPKAADTLSEIAASAPAEVAVSALTSLYGAGCSARNSEVIVDNLVTKYRQNPDPKIALNVFNLLNALGGREKALGFAEEMISSAPAEEGAKGDIAAAAAQFLGNLVDMHGEKEVRAEALKKLTELYPRCNNPTCRAVMEEKISTAAAQKTSQEAGIALPDIPYPAGEPAAELPYNEEFSDKAGIWLPQTADELMHHLLKDVLFYPLKNKEEREPDLSASLTVPLPGRDSISVTPREIQDELTKVFSDLVEEKGRERNVTLDDLKKAVAKSDILKQIPTWKLFFHYIPSTKVGAEREDIVRYMTNEEINKLSELNHAHRGAGAKTMAEILWPEEGLARQIGLCAKGFRMMSWLLNHPQRNEFIGKLSLDDLIKHVGGTILQQIKRLETQQRLEEASQLYGGKCYTGNEFLETYREVADKMERVLDGKFDHEYPLLNQTLLGKRGDPQEEEIKNKLMERILTGKLISLLPRDIHAARLREALNILVGEGDFVFPHPEEGRPAHNDWLSTWLMHGSEEMKEQDPLVGQGFKTYREAHQWFDQKHRQMRETRANTRPL